MTQSDDSEEDGVFEQEENVVKLKTNAGLEADQTDRPLNSEQYSKPLFMVTR